MQPDSAEPAGLILVSGAHGRPYSAEWYESLRLVLGESGCRQLGFYQVPDDFVLSVVIPVYNELQHLPHLLERVLAVPLRKEIVLIDDCSRDGTRELLKEYETREWHDPLLSLRVLYHEVNQGKGAAVRTGFLARDR